MLQERSKIVISHRLATAAYITIVKYHQVHSIADILKTLIQFQEGAKLMDDERPEEAITTMCSAIDIFHEVARPPHRDTHLAQEALRSCYAVSGNIHTVKEQNPETTGTNLKQIVEQ